MARHWPNSAIGRPCDPCLELAAACHAEPLPLTVYTSCDDLASLARPSDHTHSTPSPEGCSGQRACTHAQLGISETAHGPTLEYRQLLHGSSTHSLTSRCPFGAQIYLVVLRSRVCRDFD